MRVFIGNLPGDTPLLELQQLLQGYNLSVDFSSQRSAAWQSRDYHFVLVRTDDAPSADRLIAEMNGRRFRGQALEARRFVERKPDAQWDGVDRRVTQLALNF